jgi:uncharacterized membrane protein
MRAYEDQPPGAASWILAKAEKSADHNRAMQRIALKTGSRDALLHRLLPFFVVLSLICASVLIAIFASAWLGGATFAASLGAVMLDYFKGQSRH